MPRQKRAAPTVTDEKRTEQVHIRLTVKELRDFEAFSRRQSVPLGALMRQALIEKMGREGKT